VASAYHCAWNRSGARQRLSDLPVSRRCCASRVIWLFKQCRSGGGKGRVPCKRHYRGIFVAHSRLLWGTTCMHQMKLSPRPCIPHSPHQICLLDNDRENRMAQTLGTQTDAPSSNGVDSRLSAGVKEKTRRFRPCFSNSIAHPYSATAMAAIVNTKPPYEQK
jgi:hypothetical protein